MKKIIILTVVTLMSMMASANEQEVNLRERTGNQGRTEGVMPPVVTYNDVEGTLTVSLDAQAVDAYVEVTNDTNGGSELATVLTSTYVVMPMPTLDDPSYTVTLTDATGTTYEGTLTIQ